MISIGGILKNEKKRNLLFIAVYLSFLVISYSFVSNALNKEYIVSAQNSKKSPPTKPKTANVTFNYPNNPGTADSQVNIRYSSSANKLDQSKTVAYFMEVLRDEGLLIFEVTRYTDEIIVDTVDKIEPRDGYVWRVYQIDEGSNRTDVTDYIYETNLADGYEYSLSLVKAAEQ